ncbi:MAG: helicase-related protein [Spirochaetota bacterium]|nr:helicase-related protein [Spirochaetota bacterium]
MSNFITNDQPKNLLKRLQQLIAVSEELKFLVGFFYFSGIKELYESLLQNSQLKLNILVGLNVDIVNYQLVECTDASDKNLSNAGIAGRFFQSIKNSINNDEFDTEEFYKQITFFKQLIKNGNCIIRKTIKPNHAKLYIFKLKQGQVKRSLFITGSSNLTRAGLVDQSEFNVEISDYGIEEAEKYFDDLWNKAVKITEDEVRKQQLISILENDTFIKEITPFEAYCLVVKTYLDSYEAVTIGDYLCKILDKNGYTPYRYQLDAVSQALSIIQKHNGVILADVVGLGKTIIACAIAKQLKKRGIVICPPGLVGDTNKTAGWSKYLEDFQLFDWEARSLGDLENVLEFVNGHEDIEVIIIDEAHRFRNQDTRAYELLKNICRNKIVIALTATPFNNKPGDIFSLIKLFVTPKKSTVTLDNNIEYLFSEYRRYFDRLSYIKRYYNSSDKQKRERAKVQYKMLFRDTSIDLNKVNRATHRLAQEIREVIEPITIRRNRIDLQKNPYYKDEVKQLSKVCDPIEWFYELSQQQLQFYDTVIQQYFGDTDDGGLFKGAIYRPFVYEEGELQSDLEEAENENQMEKNREYFQQMNLFHFMRRLLVKRFESSFGAFKQSIENFKKIHQDVLQFITKTGKGNPLNGEYILDRALLEKIYDLDLDEIEGYLIQYEEQINAGVLPKKHKRYKIKDFKYAKEFIDDIQADINLFDTILEELDTLELVNNDPKLECLIQNIQNEFSKKPKNNEPKRKIVIFSEFKDTVKYVEETLNKAFNQRVLVVAGDLTPSKIQSIYKNFDASFKNQEDDYDILLCTDKISEGFNLNRAGMIINYDIPWNPVRVIQRLGRINRISKKVFDELYIVNFFPTEKGAEIVKSREIAQNKMFMIHNTLGEDAKIFDIDEVPTPAELYNRLQQNPETGEAESFYTKMLNVYLQLKEQYPEVIKNLHNLPRRIKVSRRSNVDELLVFFKKNRLYVMQYDYNEKEIRQTSLEEVLERIQCSIHETSLPIDERFWRAYEEIKNARENTGGPSSELSLYRRALGKLNFLISNNDVEEINQYKEFLMLLREDILDYGTLSEYTLRRIANFKTDFKNENEKQQLLGDIDLLRCELGDSYLVKEKFKHNGLQKEIIIAIENKIVKEE